nr:piggyBac transposable element-derived protein 4-like [Paramormyrops kingsleyae]
MHFLGYSSLLECISRKGKQLPACGTLKMGDQFSEPPCPCFIISVLRLDNKATRAEREDSDKLAAIRDIWDLWADRLPALYSPGENVTVDERLIRFRGRCSFRQYLPNKPRKYSIKLWVTADASSNYAWKVQVYTGKPTERAEVQQATRVVLEMTEGLHGHCVTVDNFFTSYDLG